MNFEIGDNVLVVGDDTVLKGKKGSIIDKDSGVYRVKFITTFKMAGGINHYFSWLHDCQLQKIEDEK